MRGTPGLVLILIVLGAGWGITQPLAKIAVSGGYQPLGLIFWQMVIVAVVLGVIVLLRGRALPMTARHIKLYTIIALIGTVLPGAASYRAIFHLPSGVVSILLSLVPMIAFPVALMLGNDRFSWFRLLGLLTGLVGVLLLTVPDASLPEPDLAIWVLIALLAPVCYACEGNYVARWGTEGLDPIQTLCGGSIIGMIISLPLAVFSGQWISPLPPWGAADGALLASSVIHAGVYSSYVWLVGRAGPSFAVQVSYLVTGFGVLWAMALLGEAYSGFVWVAMGLMLIGIFLVQPRENSALVPAPSLGNDSPDDQV
ncbi:DMT family transporter [Aliiroseovarius sp. YM-037]|uniref:DMT family transporter n=1 Tax=Aliiroseovarius sp. YM-037 TaxID=3341728 RepID=UPI003A7FC5F5